VRLLIRRDGKEKIVSDAADLQESSNAGFQVFILKQLSNGWLEQSGIDDLN